MDFNQAKIIALGLNKNFNSCREYKKGYHFYEKNQTEIDGDSGAVVLKENGKAINFVDFILNYHPEKNPIEIDLNYEKI